MAKTLQVAVDQFAVYEDDAFIGAVVYGAGPAQLSKYVGVGIREACELSRVALADHRTPVSRIIAISLRLLRVRRPELRAVVSYADTSVGHYGGIYQAGGWIYTGDATATPHYWIKGELLHGRTCGQRYGTGGQSIPWLREHIDPEARRVNAGLKHRYLMAFDEPLRQSILKAARPYPKRVKQAMAGHPPAQRQCGTDLHAP